MPKTDALIVVDVQNDFCPGGALAVAQGDEVVPVLNRYIDNFKAQRFPIVATRDWHPEKTTHFKDYGGLWPPHCIQGTYGAQFHPWLKVDRDVIIVSKGMGSEEDSYSGFQGRDEDGTKLEALLRQHDVERVFVGGLATDFCVKHTVLDALEKGFKVVLLEDAVRGVNLTPDASRRAIAQMIEVGAEVIGRKPAEVMGMTARDRSFSS